MTEPTLCRTCGSLKGCKLIGEPPEVQPEKVSTDENPRQCSRWSNLGHRARAIRLKAYQMSGLSALQAVRMLNGTEVREVEVQPTEPKPDFKEMAGDVIAYKAREEQLRYRTDDDGNFILDGKGQKILRDSHWLRDYAIKELGADQDVVWFWESKQLIDWVLKQEKEAGIVVTADQKRKIDKQKIKEEPKMPRTVNLRRPGAPAPKTDAGAAAPKKAAAGPKLARPATGKTKDAGNGESAPKTKKAAPEAVAAEVDLSPVLAELKAIREALEGLPAEVDKRVDKRLNEMGNVIEEMLGNAAQHTEDGQTVLHDVLMQTITGSDENSLLAQGYTIHAYMQQGEEGGEDGSGN